MLSYIGNIKSGVETAKQVFGIPSSITTNNAIEILTAQHREFETLLIDLQSSESHLVQENFVFFEALNEKMLLHFELEESILYPAIHNLDQAGALEAVEEHSNIRAMLRKLREAGSCNISFNAKVDVLKELIQHHVKEEEELLFPQCKEAFDSSFLEALGNKMLAQMQRQGEPQ